MGVVLPNELAFVLDLIGISWPNVDEDDYREMATSLREFADDCDHGGTGLGVSVANLLGATEGPAIEAFNAHWTKVSSHLGNLGEAARLGATALDGVAVIVEGAKIAAIVQLGIMAAEIIAAQAAAPFTLGLSELGAVGATQLTRVIVKRAFKEAAEAAVDQLVGMVTGPVFAAIGSIAGDLVIQLGANAMGVKNGVDLSQTAKAGEDGFKLASAGGSEGGPSSAGGSGGSGSGQIKHDDDAYDEFHSSAGDHTHQMRTRSQSRMARVTAAKSRSRGKSELTQAADEFVEQVVTGIKRGADDITTHIDGDVRTGVKRMKTNHRENDDRTARDLEGLHKAHSLEQLRKFGDRTPVYLVDDAGVIHHVAPDGSKRKADSANDPLLKRLLADGNPLPQRRKKSIPLKRKPPRQEGPRAKSQPVEAGSTELSRATQLARHTEQDDGNRNYAAFRFNDGNDEFIIVGHSTDSRHSERVLGIPFSRSDMDTQVTEAYTERAPCRTHPYHCGEWLQKYYPQTDVSHSFEYGENATGNDAEELKKAREASQARGNKALDTYTTSLGRTFRR